MIWKQKRISVIIEMASVGEGIFYEKIKEIFILKYIEKNFRL